MAAVLGVTVEAAPKTTAKSNSPKTSTTSPKTNTTTKAPSTTTAKGSSTKTKAASPKSTSAKADHAGGSKAKAPKSTTTTAKGNGSSKKTSTTTTPSTSVNSNLDSNPDGNPPNSNVDGNPPTGTTTTTTWQPTNAVSEKLMTKPNQLARLKAVLPAGTDINKATAGFKNFGQLNAAVNASQNLGINFADLKASMTGITIDGRRTNQPTKSLGQSIQQFKPGVDGDAAAAAATTQASIDGGR